MVGWGGVQGTARFSPGQVAVRRDVLRDRVWSATACRVIADRGSALVLACWPGAQLLAPVTWIRWLVTGDEEARKQALPDLAAGCWELGPWTWQRTTLVAHLHAGDFFSVSRYIDPRQESPPDWYVNFELPYRRTALGVDTFDLLLDLVIDADLSHHRWKDEDEYAHARRLGIITEHVHRQIGRARDRVLGLARAGRGPFTQDWSAWCPPDHWAPPTLPPDATNAADSPA